MITREFGNRRPVDHGHSEAAADVNGKVFICQLLTLAA